MKRFLTALFALAFVLAGPALGQSIPKKWLSAATTNSTLVWGKQGIIGTGIVVNTNATVYYLKFYNKATAPVCGTDVPVWTVPIPSAANSSPGGFVLPLGDGLKFSAGIGFCITSGIADNDTGAAATGIAVNLGFTGS